MKINSANGKTVVTLDEDEALIQYDGKTEIQKQQLSNNNTKDEANHVFALYSESEGGYLDINSRSYSRYNIIESREAYQIVRNGRPYLHTDNMFSVPFYFDDIATATYIADKVTTMVTHPIEIEVVEFEQETGLIIGFY